jgi:N-acetyl-gamma-glutamyl-phosphate reductase
VSVRVFIDGGAGTTGLEIRERLAGRSDIRLLTLPDDRRRDPEARRAALNEADAVVLCLPDNAAREAVALIESPAVRVIDASTAHRTDPDWTYGFAELEPGRAAAIAGSARVSNPGCYPTGFLALVRPLVRAGLLPPSTPLAVYAASGYSGGGKAMIAAFEDPSAPDATSTAFRTYGLTLSHKHAPEMRVHAGLDHAPIFAPAVVRAYRGMVVEVPLHRAALPGSATGGALREALAEAYRHAPLVTVASAAETADLAGLAVERTAGTDRLEMFVFANEAAGQYRLVAALDNLGKGAAGAAVQNLNLATGLEELAGLRL